MWSDGVVDMIAGLTDDEFLELVEEIDFENYYITTVIYDMLIYSWLCRWKDREVCSKIIGAYKIVNT